MDERLLSDTIQQFIREHENDDERKLVLRVRAVHDVPIALIAQQISGRRKAKEKLPSYFSTPGIVFPPAVNLEQCSSETTAVIKGNCILDQGITKSSRGLDLSGGFGVDSFFLSRIAKTLDVVEPDADLLLIAAHNHHQLGADNITYHNTSAEEFLGRSVDTFDFVFVDPSRRLKGNQKVFKLADSVPDVVALQSIIFAKSRLLLIKTSPLMDIPLGLQELKTVSNVFVVSVQNECKEVLFLCERNFTGEAVVTAINIRSSGEQNSFTFNFSEERYQEIEFSDPRSFLYEPDAAILKSGAFKTIANRFGVKKIQASTHFYTSDVIVENFPGRIFKIIGEVKPDRSEVARYFHEKKGNVTTRNYPLTPEELKKKTGLKDGGERYLIGFSGINKKFLVVAERLR